MEQLAMGLFRNTDPITSIQAAQFFQKSGARSSQKSTVLDFVRSHPALTSKEIAKALDMCRYAVARRLPDLESDGSVCKCGIKQIGGERDAVTWRAN
jgi:predicted ArsR family transcriptional regulator|tara:strand:+ start:7292 stop:7582 length:291 start_codon:yes stop_codon:yes gene_type:complete